MKSYNIELDEYEVMNTFEAIEVFIYNRSDYISEKIAEKQKLVRKIASSKIGVKTTLFGSKKTAPYSLEFLSSLIHKYNELDDSIRTVDRYINCLQNVLIKLTIPDYCVPREIESTIDKENQMWDSEVNYFQEFLPDISISQIKEIIRKAL